MFGLGPMEMIIVGIVAVLLFGSRLPSVARSAGRSLTEFKKGMQGVQDDLRGSVYDTPDPLTHDDRQSPSAPPFTPPTAEPAPNDHTASV